MTKLKFGVASVIAIASVATPLGIQRHSLAQLRQENQGLHQQIAQLASVTQENEQLSNRLVKATAQSRDSNAINELLRLRGEVRRLRSAEQELARLRQENAKLASTEQEAGAASRAGQSELPRFIYVGGEVSTPGRFIWTNGMTLATVIELAHGYTDAANRSIANVRDESGSLVTINHGGTPELKETSAIIQPGVTVLIPLNDGGEAPSR